MSDRSAVAVAVAAVIGAFLERGPSAWVGLVLVLVALAVRQPALLVCAVFALAGARAVASDAGLRAAGVEGRADGWVTVLTDPEPSAGGLRADVRLSDGRHAQAEARGDGATSLLAHVQAGDEAQVRGVVRRAQPGASWLRARHIAVILRVDDLVTVRDGALWSRAANGVRGVLADGAQVLPERQRSLFLGFVLGDTRGQPIDIADDFRGAGLTHLLAVSGQNVAFVLALAGPFLRRASLWTRLPATLGVIAFFALVTRFEPSVLRASVMAALAVTATTIGREASSLRLLSLAVASLVIVDPFLVSAVGFQLSVAACVGIVTLSSPLARVLPGPRALANALSVTIAAQAGVAPVLVSVFDGVPVVAIPANLLAAPVAGPVMVWGMAAGIAAGLSGGALAAVLHWPTGAMIGWIAFVARRAALVRAGELGWRELALLVAAAAGYSAARRAGVVSARRASVAAIAIALAAPAVALRAAPPLHVNVSDGATLWRRGAVVLDVDGRAEGARLLEGLRRAGVTRIDLLVARSESTSMQAMVAALSHRYPVGSVVSPSSVSQAEELVVGRLVVSITPRSARGLLVEITEPGLARGPPV